MPASDRTATEAAHQTAEALDQRAPNYDSLLEDIGKANVMLLSEASRGTYEFYLERARITERLIVDKFVGVAVEADWPLAEPAETYPSGL